MRKRAGMYLRVFKCPVCGSTTTAPKITCTGTGHVKTMYCAICRKETDHEQIDRLYVRHR